MKDLKISKKLLSEVLGINTILMDPILEPGNNIGYLVYGSQNTPEEVHRNHKQINIYEFTFKCKEWIISKDYYLSTFIDFGVDNYFCEIKWFNSDHIIRNKNFIADTELEVIFKACEWILKERS